MDIDEYFSKLNYDEVKKKIQSFDSLKFENYTDDELLKKIIDIFAVEDKLYNPIYTMEVNKSDLYCRIRTKNFFEDFSHTKAFKKSWILGNPNPEIGRMNRKGERGLYISKSIQTAIAECRVKEGDIFTCGIFEFTENLNILMTWVSNKYYEVKNEYDDKAKLLNDFLYRYLTMSKDSKGVEIYRITNLLNKLFLEYKEADGYFYKSSVDEGYNLYINKNSMGKCVLSYIFVGQVVNNDIKILTFARVEDGEVKEEVRENAETILAKLRL